MGPPPDLGGSMASTACKPACYICKKQFDSWEALVSHLKKAHPY